MAENVDWRSLFDFFSLQFRLLAPLKCRSFAWVNQTMKKLRMRAWCVSYVLIDLLYYIFMHRHCVPWNSGYLNLCYRNLALFFFYFFFIKKTWVLKCRWGYLLPCSRLSSPEYLLPLPTSSMISGILLANIAYKTRSNLYSLFGFLIQQVWYACICICMCVCVFFSSFFLWNMKIWNFCFVLLSRIHSGFPFKSNIWLNKI